MAAGGAASGAPWEKRLGMDGCSSGDGAASPRMAPNRPGPVLTLCRRHFNATAVPVQGPQSERSTTWRGRGMTDAKTLREQAAMCRKAAERRTAGGRVYANPYLDALTSTTTSRLIRRRL
jgi:hypothetical protein